MINHIVQNSGEGSQPSNSPSLGNIKEEEVMVKTEGNSKGYRGLDEVKKSIVTAAKSQMILDLCTDNTFPEAKEADAMAFECISQICVARGFSGEDLYSES
jgi:hypothetical protein